MYNGRCVVGSSAEVAGRPGGRRIAQVTAGGGVSSRRHTADTTTNNVTENVTNLPSFSVLRSTTMRQVHQYEMTAAAQQHSVHESTIVAAQTTPAPHRLGKHCDVENPSCALS
jgi:hypothetical protein